MEEAESTSILGAEQIGMGDHPRRMITIGKDDQVPLEEIWREADPLCRFCQRGLQLVVGGPRRVCGCAIRNIMRRRHGQTPSAPLVKVEKSPASEEHARAKMDRLRREADRQRAEIQRREAGYDEGVDEAMAAATTEAKKLNAIAVSLDGIAEHLEHLDDQWIQLLAEFAEQTRVREETEAQRQEQVKLYDKACNAVAAVRARAQRRLDDTAGARARLENLERRIALHLAAHPELDSTVGGET